MNSEQTTAYSRCPRCGSGRQPGARYCGSCAYDFNATEIATSGPRNAASLGSRRRPLASWSRAELALLGVLLVVLVGGVGVLVVKPLAGGTATVAQASNSEGQTPTFGMPESTPAPTLAPTPAPTLAPTAAPTDAPAVLVYSLTFSGSYYSGNVVDVAPYGPNAGCQYGEGGTLATFMQLIQPSTYIDHIIFSDSDGPGPANPQLLVIVNGISYIWDRDSNLRFEGSAGGTITYFAGGLGVNLSIDLHEIADASKRLRVVGTMQCPPNPLP
jgi:hypothetical protein